MAISSMTSMPHLPASSDLDKVVTAQFIVVQDMIAVHLAIITTTKLKNFSAKNRFYRQLTLKLRLQAPNHESFSRINTCFIQMKFDQVLKANHLSISRWLELDEFALLMAVLLHCEKCNVDSLD